MASHGCELFSRNKRYEERLQMEEERLRLLRIRAGNRILRQSTQLFEDLILLHVRTPSACQGADQAEKFEVGKVSSTMAFRPQRLPLRPAKEAHCVTPTVEVVGNDAFCMYNNQVHSRRKLPLDTKTRILIERTRKASRNIENIRAGKNLHLANALPTSEQGQASGNLALANLPFIPQGGLLSLTAPKTAKVRYRKPEKRRKGTRKFGVLGAVAMAGEYFGDLGHKRQHHTMAGPSPGLVQPRLPAIGFRRTRTTM